MSDMPSGPGARPNKSAWAPQDTEGRVSAAAVFTAAPRLTGADQGSWTLSRVEIQTSCPPSVPDRFEEKTSSRPSLRTFGWISFAAASFSSATGAAGPKLPSPSVVLAKMSPGTLAELREKYRTAPPLTSTYEGPCSSRALFGPSGVHARCTGSLQPCTGLNRVK